MTSLLRNRKVLASVIMGLACDASLYFSGVYSDQWLGGLLFLIYALIGVLGTVVYYEIMLKR